MSDEDSAAALRQAIAANIRAERARAHLSQQQLAAAMKQRGYRWHFQTVGAVERGERHVAADELLALAGVLGTDPGLLWRVPQ